MGPQCEMTGKVKTKHSYITHTHTHHAQKRQKLKQIKMIYARILWERTTLRESKWRNPRRHLRSKVSSAVWLRSSMCFPGTTTEIGVTIFLLRVDWQMERQGLRYLQKISGSKWWTMGQSKIWFQSPRFQVPHYTYTCLHKYFLGISQPLSLQWLPLSTSLHPSRWDSR